MRIILTLKKYAETIINLFKKEKILIISIILIAFLIRLYFLRYQPILWGDGGRYVYMAREIANKLGYKVFANFLYCQHCEVYWSQLFITMIASFTVIIKNAVLAGKFVATISGSLIILPSYFLAKEFFNKKTAIYTSILIAISPFFIWLSIIVHCESIFTFLILSSIYFFWKAINKKKYTLYFISGILFGLSYLTRGEGLILFILAIPTTLFFKTKKTGRLRRKFYNLSFLLLGFCLISAQYINCISQQRGEFILGDKLNANLIIFGKGTDLKEQLLGLSEDGTQRILYEEFETFDMTDYLKKNYENLIEKFFKNILSLFNNISKNVIYLIAINLIIISIFSKIIKKEYKKQIYLLTYLSPSLIFILLAPNYSRYFLFIMPVLMMWLVHSFFVLSMLVSKISRKFKKIKLERILFAILLLIFVINLPSVPKSTSRDFAMKDAGIWIKENLPPDSGIISNRAIIDGHLGIKTTMLPKTGYNTLIKYAKYKNIDYIVIDNGDELTKIDKLSFLLAGKETPELQPIYNQGGGESKVVIYKLK